MWVTGKSLLSYTSKNSFLKEINSKLISSLNKKTIQKVSTNRRRSIKPQSRMKKIGTKKNTVDAFQKTSGRSSTKCQSSPESMGKKPSALHHRENMMHKCGDGVVRRRDRRKIRKGKKNNIVRDEASRLQGRARNLLIKMKLEQNLIDAYSGEGWKGQSKEKLKPVKELQRAEKQILRCKLGIRDTIRQLHLLSSEGHIEDSVVHPDGSVFHEHIFCAKCKVQEAFPDNDIVLCDGTCNCGFHQKCLDPPLEKIPPGDQGWLCKFCECKMEILEAINAHIGTSFTVNSSWEEIFEEATTVPDTENTPNPEEWPSEDSEDEDYCPDKTEHSNSKTGIEEIVSDDASSSSSLFCSSIDVSIDSGEASDCEITNYRRQRRDVDYKKLYDEMFGKELNDSEQQSEDEDWGPRRRKRRRDTDVGSNVADSENMVRSSNMVLNENISHDRRTLFRIPRSAVERLRQVFTENELPSRAVKENLSNQLGISAEKVGKWFKNARYAALKMRKAEMTNQPQNNDVAERLRMNTREHGSDGDGVEPMDMSYFLPLSSIVRVPQKLRRIHQKKDSRSVDHLRKAHKGSANGLISDKIKNAKNHFASKSCKISSSNELNSPHRKVSTWLKDPVHLKMKGSGLARKSPLGKASYVKGTTPAQVDVVTKNEQLYLHEVERLSSLQDRLQKLKKILLTCKDDGRVPNNIYREPYVMYVPVAEVKEKSSIN
ncbi:pathogenesis-related homeodomain protein isoform X1 [Iris pallida]|uniref:Pathogenesis-related homeodomain protein isoform X1 n=1 Tax=Iris pallida TaxID=29817 RepID=A0AAX6IL11_IRIPA|nr:pathogenesis-related homeodomain protein isoform X1 [Iris pallida]